MMEESRKVYGWLALLGFALFALSSIAGQRMVVSQLPEAARPLAEVETNVVFSTGAEFIVLMFIESEQEILDTIENIRKELELFNSKKERVYELSFSIGYSILSDGSSVDSFLNKMDENMYVEKRQKHTRTAEKSFIQKNLKKILKNA